MSFDSSQLAALAPLVALTVGGCLLLLLEAFARGQGRGYLMPMAVATLGIALVLDLLQWSDAETGHTVFSGTLALDRYTVVLNGIFLVAALLTALLAPAFMREHDFEFGEMYSLLVFATAGMCILVAATDLTTLFLGVETMSIAVYVLTGSWRHSAKSAEGAMKYFMVGAFATSVLLYGMALIYGASGTTSLAAIAEQGEKLGSMPLFLIGAMLVLVAFGFKVSAVPFHMWAPDAYEGAPTPVTAFMATAVKAAAFAALIRVVSTAFSAPEVALGSGGWANSCAWLALFTMTLGNLGALKQDNVKRMLAYSSIAHAGYLLVGVVAVALAGDEARGALIYYLAAYTFTTVGAFGVVAWIGSRNHERQSIEDWAGLARSHPAVALAMTIFMLSLGGIPPTAGFFGKLYLFRAALSRPGLVWLVVAAVANSVISVFYYLRVVTAMFFRDPAKEAQPLRATSTHAALLLACLGVLLLGILPGWLVDTATQATLAH